MTPASYPTLVVGTGFGCRVHVPALRAAGFDVVGVVGTDAERTARRAQAAQVLQSFTDLGAAIEATGAKVVSIATPPSTHAELALTAITRACHVICEKPFAMNVTEARRLLQAAEQAGVVHLIGHEFRWQPDRVVIARAIAEGLIGEPRLVSMLQYLPLIADPQARMPPWWFDASAGGGWLGASGSHIIDQIRSSLGEFESISAALPVVSQRGGAVEDTYSIRFRLKNGAEGCLQQTAAAWGPYTNLTRIAGTHGTLWTEAGGVRLADRDGVRELPIPAELQLPAPPAAPEGAPKRHAPPELTAFTRFAEVFRDAIEGRSHSAGVPIPTFADGLACMEVMDAVRASAVQGGAMIRLA